MKTLNSYTWLICLVLVVTSAPGALADNPTLLKSSGDITVNGTDLETGRTVHPGDLLVSNRSETSYIDLKFPSGHRIRFKNAKVTIQSVDPILELELHEGAAFTAYESNDTSKKLRIRTAHAIAGVRGTKFFIQAKPDETYVCVCKGAVWMEKRGLLNAWFSEQIVVPEGYDAHLRPKKKMPTPSKSPSMVRRTWKVFRSMGYEVPSKYQ